MRQTFNVFVTELSNVWQICVICLKLMRHMCCALSFASYLSRLKCLGRGDAQGLFHPCRKWPRLPPAPICAILAQVSPLKTILMIPILYLYLTPINLILAPESPPLESGTCETIPSPCSLSLLEESCTASTAHHVSLSLGKHKWSKQQTTKDSLRGSSVKIGTVQRRLAWPLRKDHTHKSRSVNNC